MKTLVIATRNAHKAREIQTYLGERFRYLTLRELSGAPPIDETATTFAENARLKSEGVACWLLLKRGTDRTQAWWVLADDSGLEVDALHGDPGVRSARFAASEVQVSNNAPDGANNEKLLRLLADVPEDERTGRFRCALSLTEIGSGLPSQVFEGVCEGRIIAAPRGTNGFGYDPLFVPDGFSTTFAELSSAEKSVISHRAKALEGLRAWADRRFGHAAHAKAIR